MYTLKDLLVECSTGVGGSGPLEDYATIWRAMTKAIQEAIHAGKGINIPYLGRFTVVKNSLRESPGFKGKVFVLSDTFQRNHGALFKKPGLGLLAPCNDLNLAKLGVTTQFDKDTAQALIAHLMQNLGRAIGKGQRVRVTFGHVGALVAEDHRVSFNYFSEDSIPEHTSVTATAREEMPTAAATEPARELDNRAQTSTSAPNNTSRDKDSGAVPASERQTKPAASAATASPSAPRKKTTPTVPPLAVHKSNPPSFRGNNNNKASEAAGAIKPSLRNEASSRVTVGNLLGQDGDKEKAPLALTEDNVRHLPNGVDVDLNIKPTSLFPTKAVAGPVTGRSVRDQGLTYQRTMMDAYHRLEDRLAKQVTDDERAMRMIKEREALADEMHQKEKQTRKQKQEEWRAFLSRQAEEQSKLRKEEHYRDFLAPPPTQVTAYPQNAPYDRNKKSEIEKSLRQTLEEQIKVKEEKKKAEKEQNLYADQQLIQWVRDEERQEKNNRLAKRIMDRESLFREWNIQRAHLAEVKRLGPGKIY